MGDGTRFNSLPSGFNSCNIVFGAFPTYLVSSAGVAPNHELYPWLSVHPDLEMNPESTWTPSYCARVTAGGCSPVGSSWRGERIRGTRHA